MKIPKELLQASMSELMSGDLKQYFIKNGYNGIPEWTNTGCAFFCYMNNKTCRDVKGKVHNVKLEYYEIEVDDYKYPLIRFDVVVYDRLDQPLHFDSFLNIGDESCVYVLGALMEQEWLIFHWYGEDFKYRGSTGIRWKNENREWVGEIWETGKMCINGIGIDVNEVSKDKDNKKELDVRFNKAKEKFIKNNPLS